MSAGLHARQSGPRASAPQSTDHLEIEYHPLLDRGAHPCYASAMTPIQSTAALSPDFTPGNRALALAHPQSTDHLEIEYHPLLDRGAHPCYASAMTPIQSHRCALALSVVPPSPVSQNVSMANARQSGKPKVPECHRHATCSGRIHLSSDLPRHSGGGRNPQGPGAARSPSNHRISRLPQYRCGTVALLPHLRGKGVANLLSGSKPPATRHHEKQQFPTLSAKITGPGPRRRDPDGRMRGRQFTAIAQLRNARN